MAALPDGARLGPYEILAPLGAGGMGDVYRGRDTRLGRAVAIKLLNAELSGDATSRARFEREARSIAALAHPHICTVHDVGDHEGNAFLVMELLEGQTLAARLTRTNSALPLDEALTIATHIAEALDYAHRHRITHRDIKPANIMLTPTGVKLLDFGLAQLRDRDEVTGQSRTQSSLTGPLGVVGTLAYMSPEQLDGRADERSDVFSFGAVLFEMLTGRKAFDGATSSAVIGAVVQTDPPAVSSLRPGVSASLDRVVRRCLAKDPDARWQSTADLVDELKWTAGHSLPGADTIAVAAPVHRRSVAVLAMVAAAAIGVAIWSQQRNAAPPAQSVRFLVLPPDHLRFQGSVALSPDGQHLALVTIDDQRRTQLWVRSMRSEVAQRIAGADGVTLPFWSPDSQSIGFFADRRLKRVAASGGPPIVICEAEDGRGGTWNKDGVIVFAPRTYSPMMMVSASGGSTPQPVTQLDPLSSVAHRWPHFLPDGDHFLYLSDAKPGNQSVLRVGSLRNRESQTVLHDTTEGQYSDGLLFFVRREVLLAQPFDTVRLAVSGEPRAVAQDLTRIANGRYAFSVTPSGSLAFLRRSDLHPVAQLTWFDRSGKPTGTLGQPERFSHPSIAPDDNRIAVTRWDDKGPTIWVFEAKRGTATRLTSQGHHPVWSPDGHRMVFSALPHEEAAVVGLWTIPADGSGPEAPLLQSTFPVWPLGWSPDGTRLLYHLTFGDQKTASGLWWLTIPGSRSTAFRNDRFLYAQSAVSPDGHWIAYSSNQSGRPEVYVESFPTPGKRVSVSTGGGTQPRWRRDQKELYFLSAESRLIAVPANLGAEAKLGVASPLFTVVAPPVEIGWGAHQYDVSADGRFLVAVVVEHVPDRPPVTVAFNATTSLKPKPAP